MPRTKCAMRREVLRSPIPHASSDGCRHLAGTVTAAMAKEIAADCERMRTEGMTFPDGTTYQHFQTAVLLYAKMPYEHRYGRDEWHMDRCRMIVAHNRRAGRRNDARQLAHLAACVHSKEGVWLPSYLEDSGRQWTSFLEWDEKRKQLWKDQQLSNATSLQKARTAGEQLSNAASINEAMKEGSSYAELMSDPVSRMDGIKTEIKDDKREEDTDDEQMSDLTSLSDLTSINEEGTDGKEEEVSVKNEDVNIKKEEGSIKMESTVDEKLSKDVDHLFERLVLRLKE